MKVCLICRNPRKKSGDMCAPCAKSYDRTAHRDGSVMEAMVWAANRARRFERQRQKRNEIFQRIEAASLAHRVRMRSNSPTALR